MIEWMELSCPACDWRSLCGPPQMLTWLRSASMVRRDAAPEADLLPELFKSAAEKLACPKCLVKGLVAIEPEPESDEAWGMARRCSVCDAPIAPERLEIFPDADLCVVCQGRADRGESNDTPEYCPRCGNLLRLQQVRRGVTRYVMACPQCRS